MSFLIKLWLSLNYRYCMAEAYLMSQQGRGPESAYWLGKAMDWQREFLMCGRRMV
jgi:hypothetical protein